ncbi:TPA: hypothetical protein DD394_05360 [bacterium UBP9_UBA11836]|nr:hypothetical protein [bacterium UBP9_UBA11836]
MEAKMKRKANLDDGCNPELVRGAKFDGLLDIPVISAPDTISVPTGFTPFTKRDKSLGTDDAICFFEKDPKFAEVLIDPAAYIEDFRRFRYLLPTDCSLYVDAPLAVQITNLYRSRAIASYYQGNGCNVYPMARWGNEHTYTTDYFPERVAFLGLPKHSVTCIGTYGCINSRIEKYYFKHGLKAMLDTLEPEVVMVYGAMPSDVFGDYLHRTEFIQYPDWTTRMHGGNR